MDVLELLRKVGVSEDDLAYFDSSYVFPPAFNRTRQVLTVFLRITKALPFAVYCRVKNAFETKLKGEVELSLSCDQGVSNVLDVFSYMQHFAQKNNYRIISELYPKEKEDGVYIHLPKRALREEEHTEVIQIQQFLIRCGMKAYIQEAKEQENPMQNSQTFTPYTENTEESFRRVKFDKEKCKYVPLSVLNHEADDIYIEGQIVSVEYFTTRKETEIQTVVIHEGLDAFVCKRFEGRNCPREVLHSIKENQWVRLYGSVRYDKYSNGNVMTIQHSEPIDAPAIRKDEEDIKRVELHAHTNKSEMDGVCGCSELIKRAYKWGHKAIAITDHMVVQAYPDAQNTHLAVIPKNEKGKPIRDTDFKVIYGIEMNMADDRATIVYNCEPRSLYHATYVCFDLETTGLSSSYDEIIEFGAVKIQNGNEVARMQVFVKPETIIPPLIEQKTNITNAMVKNAEPISVVIDQILDFIGDDILVAHNASFDLGFIQEALRKLNRKPITNPVIDTLPLSWVMFPERKRFALGYLVRGYKIEYDEEDAHRADYDAEVLSLAFIKMLQEFDDKLDTMSLDDLQNLQTEQIYKKIHASHVNILAKNQQGVKSIYELVTLSHTKYLTYSDKADGKEAGVKTAEARIVRSEIQSRREHILVGSSCYNSDLFELARNRSQKELEEAIGFYDYIEVQPLGNYARIVDERSTFTQKRLQEVVENVIYTAKRLGKIVVATGDSHYIDPEEKLLRDIYIHATRIGGARHPLYDRSHTKEAPDQHLKTTREMLDEFSFLPEELAYEIVVTNTNLIADQCQRMYPLMEELKTPSIEGCEEKLAEEIYATAYSIYGNPLPEIVQARIEKELGSVTKHGFSVQYYIAHLLVKRSRENGYVVGSRGSVGSSFIATMANITEVNPLDPHYICPKCKHSEFFTHGEYPSGFDLPEKKCPQCGTVMRGDGHSIPFETFLGFKGDKVPDIDLNFSGEYQAQAQAQIKEVFGDGYVFAAGTVATASDKTAYGYVKKYCEENNVTFNKQKMDYLGHLCEGVKRTTGQHPGGIVVCPKEYEIHDFTPVQYPANNPDSEWMTTHFAIKDIHDNILKLDILGHVDPTAMKMLRDQSGIDPVTVPINDKETMSLFSSTEALHLLNPEQPYPDSTGAAGLPEFGTPFIRGILEMTRPTTFAELVSLAGLTHGTDVWLNNAKDLIDAGICTLKEVIGCRDDIMVYLIQKGLPPVDAFNIMEIVRKGKWLKQTKEKQNEMIALMKEHDVPDWYIGSCTKIKYMFPKAHAVAYVMMCIRIAWYKVHMPQYYYSVFFSCRCDAYEIETMAGGIEAVYNRMTDIKTRSESKDRAISSTVTNKEESLYSALEVVYEMYRRGYSITNIDINRSHATQFTVDPDDCHKIIPPFTAMDGLGEAVGLSIMKARDEQPFISKQDLAQRTQLSGTHIQKLEEMGCLKGMQDTNQLSLF